MPGRAPPPRCDRFPSASSAPRGDALAAEGRRDFLEEPLELTPLVPGGQAQADVPQASVQIGAEARDAFLGATGYRPALDEGRTEIGRVVRVQELLGLVQRSLAVLVDVDVVIEGTAQPRRIATLVAGQRGDAGPLGLE